MFGDKVVHLVIDGVSGRDISETFGLPRQQEVVYLPNTKIEIRKVKIANDGNPLIFAREVASNENIRTKETGSTGNNRPTESLHQNLYGQRTVPVRNGRNYNGVSGEIRSGNGGNVLLSQWGKGIETRNVLGRNRSENGIAEEVAKTVRNKAFASRSGMAAQSILNKIKAGEEPADSEINELVYVAINDRELVQRAIDHGMAQNNDSQAFAVASRLEKKLVKAQDDRYLGKLYPTTNIDTVYFLVSAFEYNGKTSIAKLEVKRFKNQEDNNLYLIVTAGENKDRATFVPQRKGDLESHNSHPRSGNSTISIPQVLENMQTQDEHFIKYFPDDMLSDTQKSIKESLLKDEDEFCADVGMDMFRSPYEAERVLAESLKSSNKSTVVNNNIKTTIAEKLNKISKSFGIDNFNDYINVQKKCLTLLFLKDSSRISGEEAELLLTKKVVWRLR